MRTDTLAWRFEFMSSTEAVETHFVVEQGAFAPRDIPDLEVTDGAISASRCVETPSRHRRDSFPSHDDVGGFFFRGRSVAQVLGPIPCSEHVPGER